MPNRLLDIIACIAIILALHPLTAQECDESTLDFETAFSMVLESSPELKAYEIGIAVKEAEGWQAGCWPNPEFAMEIENIAGSKQYAGWKSREIKYFLSQLFEMSDKRSIKVKIASIQERMEYWNWMSKRWELENKLKHAFVDVFTAQEKLKLQTQQMQLEKKRVRCLSMMVDEGKTHLGIHKKAEISLRSLQALCRRAQIELQTAKMKLSSLWGCLEPDFDSVEFDFYCACPLECLEELQKTISSNPLYMRQQLEILRAQEEVALARAYACPDVIVSAGYKTTRKPHCAHALEFNFILPIPVFDKNSGNICRAKLLTQQAELELADLEIRLNEQLYSEYLSWNASYCEVEALSGLMLPDANHTLFLANEEHEEGKLPCLELIEEEKSLLEVKKNIIEALSDYHHKKIVVRELAGACQAFEET